jgi:catechol 2,3-dioxygenase-like lactoylglutathione lyase family enzyme
MDMRIELIIVPVTDVDRARDFYASLGWNVDHDQEVDETTRFVQITPPGSACSIAFGRGIAETEPGSLRGVQLVIADADAALALLRAKGVDADGVDEQAWGRFVTFRDPDGNQYTLQQMPAWSPSAANAPTS